MPDLIVDHVAKHFATRSGPLPVLRDVSVALSAGENLAIVGPSGSGKSTLLYAIGTLDPPTQGTVTLDGQDPYRLEEAALARFRNRHIGFVFQDHHLLPQLSVLENVLIPTLAEGAPTARDQQRARELLQRVGLQDRLDHRPSELSGGERGRAAVARALITGPRLVLADEPTGNLDPDTSRQVIGYFEEFNQEGKTIVMVTHDPRAAARAKRTLRIKAGKIVASDQSRGQLHVA